jgi:hypothetical protein
MYTSSLAQMALLLMGTDWIWNLSFVKVFPGSYLILYDHSFAILFPVWSISSQVSWLFYLVDLEMSRNWGEVIDTRKVVH